MKSVLILSLVFAFVRPALAMQSQQLPGKLTPSLSQQQDTAAFNSLQLLVKESGQRAPDHAPTLGETARDRGAYGVAEHLAPLILMVMAFVVAFIAGCLWWNRVPLNSRNNQDLVPVGRFRKTVLTMLSVSGIFALVAVLLLLNVFGGRSQNHAAVHQHEGAHWIVAAAANHHITEILLGFAAVLILLFLVLYFAGSLYGSTIHLGLKWLFRIVLGLALVLFLIIVFNLHNISGPEYDLRELFFIIMVWLFILLGIVGLLLGGVLMIRNIWKISSIGLHAGVFLAALLELMVVVILLNIFSGYYKLCNDSCVMLGSHAGLSFDLPCTDNIAFMTHHQTGSEMSLRAFMDEFATETHLPLFMDYASPLAMHHPLYPRAADDPVTFTLSEHQAGPDNPTADHRIKTCSLYVLVRTADPVEVITGFRFEKIPADAIPEATWERTAGGQLRRVKPLPAVPVPAISFRKTFQGTSGKITYVTYKFAMTFMDADRNRPDDFEITFVLQDYHELLPYVPAPVYGQGDMRDVMDLLFIPGDRPGGSVADGEEFQQKFRESCGDIIENVVFREPSLRFWRKQFNFWVNKEAGEVADAACLTCCHKLPDNLNRLGIPAEIDFKAMLHEGTLWDFTDPCKVFSAEMELVSDDNERSSFLHEMGHSVFWLSDEYDGGLNEQATKHLPNNWNNFFGARRDAHFRHKAKSDARPLSP